MADRKVEVVISAKDQYSSTLKRAGATFKRVGAGIGRAFKVGALAATAAIAGITAIMFKATQAAGVQEDAEIRLAAALGKRSSALLKQASALQRVTKFGDESIISAQSLIAAFVKDEDQIKAATKATLDLAAATGMDLKASAALVAKTLGSSTNALARYGVEVKGAVGSTERLEDLTGNIARLFGGQAQAQALTFSGRMTQMSNAFGDVLEQIGFFITKSSFANKVVELGIKFFADMATKIETNRLFLMGLAKDGLVAVSKGLGTAIEIMRFFHNGWLGIKLVGTVAIQAIAVSLAEVHKGLRVFLKPLDLIFEGLKKIGKIDVNPFDKIEESLGTFRASSKDVTKSVLSDIIETNEKYDMAKGAIDGMTSALKKLKVESLEVGEVTLPGVSVGAVTAAGVAPEEDPQVKLIQMRMQFRNEEIAQLMSLNDIMAFHAERGVSISNDMAAATVANNFLISESERAKASIHGKANQAMEDAILSFVQTGKFSVGALASIMAQQVKIELAGIAAKAAVQALYFAGLGIAASTPWGAASLGNPGVFFAAAGKMAAISGAAIAATAGVQAISGGTAERSAPGTPGGRPVTTEEVTPSLAGQASSAGATTIVNIMVEGLISPDNLSRVVEEQITPELSRNAERGDTIKLNVLPVEG